MSRTTSVSVRIVVFNATFNNISIISWQSVLYVEETSVPGENNQPVVSHLITYCCFKGERECERMNVSVDLFIQFLTIKKQIKNPVVLHEFIE
jgi:hypothetical protein